MRDYCKIYVSRISTDSNCFAGSMGANGARILHSLEIVGSLSWRIIIIVITSMFSPFLACRMPNSTVKFVWVQGTW